MNILLDMHILLWTLTHDSKKTGYSMKLHGMPLFYAKKWKESFMCDSKVLYLKFVGMDSWETGLFIKMIWERCGKM